MDTWTVDFAPPLGRQAIRRADPSRRELAAASAAVAIAALGVGIGDAIVVGFFDRPVVLDGYYDPRDPLRVWLRAGMPEADTARVAAHEVGHLAEWRTRGDVGGEHFPDRLAEGSAFARAWLHAADPTGIRRLIDSAAQTAVRKHRSATR